MSQLLNANLRTSSRELQRSLIFGKLWQQLFGLTTIKLDIRNKLIQATFTDLRKICRGFFFASLTIFLLSAFASEIFQKDIFLNNLT
jgi:hypothetical protein